MILMAQVLIVLYVIESDNLRVEPLVGSIVVLTNVVGIFLTFRTSVYFNDLLLKSKISHRGTLVVGACNRRFINLMEINGKSFASLFLLFFIAIAATSLRLKISNINPDFSNAILASINVLTLLLFVSSRYLFLSRKSFAASGILLPFVAMSFLLFGFFLLDKYAEFIGYLALQILLVVIINRSRNYLRLSHV